MYVLYLKSERSGAGPMERRENGPGFGGMARRKPWNDPEKGRQMACKPGSVPAPKARGMAIHLGRLSPGASRDLPGRRRGNPPAGVAGCRPYLVLLPVGFTVPLASPHARCALTAPFHPYPQAATGVGAVCFLWHFPWGRPRRALPGTVFPWSPDFPPPGAGQSLAPEGGHPAIWRFLGKARRAPRQARRRPSAASRRAVSLSIAPSRQRGRKWS